MPDAASRGRASGRSGRQQLVQMAGLHGGERSLKPPIRRSSTTIWGKLIIPVFATSSSRPSGSLERLTSTNSMPREASMPFARAQKEQGSVV